MAPVVILIVIKVPQPEPTSSQTKKNCISSRASMDDAKRMKIAQCLSTFLGFLIFLFLG
jgi:hypothetical protein